MLQLAVVVHTSNPSTRETDKWISLNSRPAWTTEQVPGTFQS